MPNYWLMKSEPFKYSWDDLVAEGEGTWDGVRNYLARNNLMAMQVGDEAFFYHSREGLEIVGIAEITVSGIGRDRQVGGGETSRQGEVRPSRDAGGDQGRAAAGRDAACPLVAPVGVRGDARGMAGDLRNGKRLIQGPDVSRETSRVAPLSAVNSVPTGC